MPDELDGWRADGPAAVYDADNLYTYIDGAAELYRSFAVRTVVARRYVNDDGGQIIVDVFDMGSSEDAFGVYRHDVHEGADVGLGQESEYSQSYLAFWKDRYFVAITALEATSESEKTILAFGKIVARAIPQEGAPPDLAAMLPQRGLRKKHVHYFHNAACLNAYYRLPDDNPLALGPDTAGVVARYRFDADDRAAGRSYVLMLVRYSSRRDAWRAHRQLRRTFLDAARGRAAVLTDDRGWVAAQRKSRILFCVFEAPNRAVAENALRAALDCAQARDRKCEGEKNDENTVE